MYVKYSVVSLGKLAIAALLFINSSGCSTRTEQINPTTVPKDAPLSVFIVGEWLSTDVTSDNSGHIDLQYNILFETESQVKLIVIYPEGGTEGYRFNYNFITQNSIFVDNKRTIGGETWLLERDQDNLEITISRGNDSIRVLLERVR